VDVTLIPGSSSEQMHNLTEVKGSIKDDETIVLYRDRSNGVMWK